MDIKKIIDDTHKRIKKEFEKEGFDISFFTWRITMEYKGMDGEQEKYIKDHIGMYSDGRDMKLK